MSLAHARTVRRAALAAVAALIATLGLLPPTAEATFSYNFAGTFSTGESPVYPFGKCNVRDLDVDSDENVYVMCGGPGSINGSGGTIIKKYDKDGNPVPFSGNFPHISGNMILEDPDPNHNEFSGTLYGSTWEGRDDIAIDRSGTGTDGMIYVSHSPYLGVFEPSGKWIASLSVPAAFGVNAITVDSEGNLYVNSQFKLNKYNASWVMVNQFFVAASNEEYTHIFGSDSLAVDSTGAVWGVGDADASWPSPGGGAFNNGSLSRLEADQAKAPEIESTFALGTYKKAKFSPLGEWPLQIFGTSSVLGANSIDVNLDDDTLFAVKAQSPPGIAIFSRGTPDELSHQLTPIFGTAAQVGLSDNDGMALGPINKTVYVAKENGVSKFTPGPPVPVVRTKEAEVADIGHTSATVRGHIELDGGTPITGCKVEYGPTKAYTLSKPCTPDPSGGNFTENTDVSAELTGLNTGSTYHYAFVASNATGTGLGINRTVRPAAVLGLDTEGVSGVNDGSATLNGSLDPDGIATQYHFEYGLVGELTQSTPPVAASGSGDQPVSAAVSNLKPGAVYSYRLVGANSLGTTRGVIKTFRVAGPPSIAGVRATEVRETSAQLNARINPGGYPTTYRFEYGKTTDYGSTIPIPPVEGDAGEGADFAPVSNQLEGLEPGVTYHFRVVATNQWGDTVGADTTFNFFPQSCPNEHVRQQTRSSYLPDCRAYELVSPANAGGVQIYPGTETDNYGFAWGLGNTLAWRHTIQNTGLAEGPSRFMFYGGLGSVTGINTVNSSLESYLSTRTANGWETTFPGLKGAEGGETGRKECSDRLDLCFDHHVEFLTGEVPRIAGYLFDADGTKVGTAPSNFKAIPGAENPFLGDMQLAPDGGSLAFSSLSIPFAPGATTDAPGTAYHNDFVDQTISIISRQPNGEMIDSETSNSEEFILFPPDGVSSNGSHILMRVKATDGPHRLYLRVNDAVTYDISNGAGVTYIGMSRSGESVLFKASQQLVTEDNDQSADVYRWDENEGVPTLTLMSQGNGQGDSDACSAAWTANCSVILLDTQRDETSGWNGAKVKDITLSGTDTKYGSEGDSVLFFSPENLDGTAPLNAKNLYLADGADVHYIATFPSSQTVERVQVAPNGEHVGFATKAALTPYDNDGFRMMYAYDARNGELTCASCLPSGDKPTTDIEASMNGSFMADDGRVFFATSDPLVSIDVDLLGLPDVYEYVEGRPQLISSGYATNAKAPGGAALFVAKTLGLEGVSASGTDVYFSTTDTLVPQDDNGRFAKIYNARTNGGFPPPEEAAPCVAADECHGAGAAKPDPLQIGTSSNVTGGNLTPAGTRNTKRGKAQRRNKRCAKRKRAGKKSTCARRGRNSR